ncbi:hypothetical protein COV24_00300 [candidate division WWE3 bacterium CG10_big_fil_rev_8_21_14_0_10_32_10]|uniref:Peptidase A2 domain-containing protein n=1 Tax=candidate division WWE3 bacterium CG10_big_fil_rev_8_21_14_0_10_32_10 TaxID=1975090 RepID=A0A2H0RBH2_UNCKA|nr:MAG: hypothetical protein COV24_00300 [candidate division WWE3 bacterium CG10_big_fil_rev_8_21_14_0_10_32_10]
MPTKYTYIAITKFFLILFLLIGTTLVFVYSYFYVLKGRPPRLLSVEPYFIGKDLLILPYITKSYSGYGRVFEPEIEMKVKQSDNSYLKISFLLDSGAVVSTLPISYADSLGKNIKNAKRIVLRGFGDNRTFGYMSNMTLIIDNKDIIIPVVFSEGELTKKIIGRTGFFDQFTITFDHKDEVIRVRE